MNKYIQLVNGSYRFRMRVPTALQELLGKKELIKGLGTKDERIAELKAKEILYDISELIDDMEMRIYDYDAVEAQGLLIRSFKDSIRNIEKGKTYTDDELEDISSQITEFNEALTTKNFKPIKRTLSNIFKEMGLDIDPLDPDSFKEVIVLISSKILEMENILRTQYTSHRAVSEVHKTKATKNVAKSERIFKKASENNSKEEFTGNTVPFSEAVQKYMSELSLEPKTEHAMKISYENFIQVCGDLEVAKITKEHIRDFKDVLLKMPKNFKQRFPTANLMDIVNTEHGMDIISPTTMNKHIQWVSSVLKWSHSNGLRADASPAEGMKVKTSKREQARNERFPFKMTQIKDFFNCPIYTGMRAANTKGRYVNGDVVVKDSWYWIPLLGLYTGARLQEICQLYATDVYQVEGVWVLDINEKGDDKSLKTSSSRRLIPIHRKLIELGFIDYVRRTSTKRLFEDVPQGNDGTYSSIFSKRFSNYTSKIGLREDKQSFHSFRHNMSDTLKNLDVPESVIKAIMGHTDSSETFGRYGSEYKVNTLKEHLDKIEYPIEI